MSATIAFDNGWVMDFSPLTTKVSDEQFTELCRRNPNLRIELTSEGDLIIMPPTGGKTGARNFYLTGKFSVWVEKDATGRGFDSSTEFTLPNGAKSFDRGAIDSKNCSKRWKSTWPTVLSLVG